MSLLGGVPHSSFSMYQHVTASCTAASQTCAITVTSTGSGHTGIIAMGTATTDVITGVSGGGTYTIPTGCQLTDNGVKTVSCAYTISTTSGATTITVTRTSATSATWRAYYLEIGSTNSIVIDTGASNGLGTRDQSTTLTTPAGVALTLSASCNCTVVQFIFGTGVTAVAGSGNTYVGDFTSNAGFAYSINTGVGAAPTWTQTSSRAAVGAIAVKESTGGGGGTSPRPLRVRVKNN